jgi:aldehyde dehydrogenase (NAD+)
MSVLKTASVVNLDDYKLNQLMSDQRQFFLSGATKEYKFRVEQLKRLKELVKENEERIFAALKADLNKPGFEAYASEIAFIYEEINFTIKNLKSWMKPKRVWTPMTLFLSSSFIVPEPLGQVLIIGPWNYPFNLVVSPLIGAIAAGNCAIIKPSELAPQTAQVVTDIVSAFPRNFVASLQGGPEVSQALLKQKFDHIFFTGGTEIGKVIAKAAAETLTPVTLELGGKSPCIVDKDTDLDLTARRIVWGKFFNAGQTCVAPDYMLVHSSIKNSLLERMKHYVHEFYGKDIAQSPDYCRIINERHFDRLEMLLNEGEIVVGGQVDRKTKFIAPTIIDKINLSHKIMQGEIFGPILPVLEYHNIDEAIHTVRRMPNPLALYVFSSNKQNQDKIIAELPFGGGCINNTLLHLGNPNLPFGGRGESGVGAYHGKFSFDCFTHKKSVVKTSFLIDPKFRYQPYKEKLNLLKKLIK